MVTKRCLAVTAAPRGTSMPSVGSVTGSRGLVRIWTSSGVVRRFAMAPSPLCRDTHAFGFERYS